MLARELGMDLVVVVRSQRQLRSVVFDAPDGFGQQPEVFHSDVMFLKAPVDRLAGDARGADPRRRRPRLARARRGVLRAAQRARAQSRMSRIVGTPSTS